MTLLEIAAYLDALQKEQPKLLDQRAHLFLCGPYGDMEVRLDVNGDIGPVPPVQHSVPSIDAPWQEGGSR